MQRSCTPTDGGARQAKPRRRIFVDFHLVGEKKIKDEKDIALRVRAMARASYKLLWLHFFFPADLTLGRRLALVLAAAARALVLLVRCRPLFLVVASLRRAELLLLHLARFVHRLLRAERPVCVPQFAFLDKKCSCTRLVPHRLLRGPKSCFSCVHSTFLFFPQLFGSKWV